MATPLPAGCEEKTARVRSMFDAIAPRYDLVNRLMTFGLDQSWRRDTVAALALPANSLVLDVACGTGDLSRLASAQGLPGGRGRPQRGHAGANGTGAPLVQADCSRSLRDGTFDGLSAATRCATSPIWPPRWPRRPGCSDRGDGSPCSKSMHRPRPSAGRLRRLVQKVVPVLGAPCRTARPTTTSPLVGLPAGRHPVYAPAARPPAIPGRHPPPGRRPEPAPDGHPQPACRSDDRHSDLHARTVPLEYGPDALQFDGSPTVLFDRPGLTLVGWGTALLVRDGRGAGSVGRHSLRRCRVADRARAWWRSGPSPSTPWPGHLIVPRFTMGIARDADGRPTAGPPRSAPPTAAARDRRALRRRHLAVRHLTRRSRPTSRWTVTELTTPLTRGLRAMVQRRRRHHALSPDATLRKVVLSRTGHGELDGPLPLSAVLRRLRAHEPNCTIFSMPVPDGTFFGASPELLIARHGAAGLECHPLAGTVATGRHRPVRRRRPGRPGRRRPRTGRAPLRGRRHRRRPCARFCDELTVPMSPRWSPSASWPIWAPGSRGSWRPTRRGPRAPERLHPTPAVGGTPGTWPGHHRRPRAGAARLLGRTGRLGRRRRRRRMDDRHPQRPLHPDGADRHVAGWGGGGRLGPRGRGGETDVKLASVLESLVPGGSVHLR
jgi:hypothetical protein